MVSLQPIGMKKRKEKTNKNQVKDKIKKRSKDEIVNTMDKTNKKKKKVAVMSVIQDENITVQKKKTKFIMPSRYITESIVESCLNALDQVAACSIKKNAIFEDEQKIFAEIHCIKIQTSTGNIKFVLPHSTAASTGEICLITPDIRKGKKIDHEPTIDHWEEILKKADVTCVKTVLPLRQLKVEYDQYELKRRLLTQHDFIMVDTRILSHASTILGKKFFKKHNMLIPVKVNEKSKDLKKCIDIGLRTTMLRLGQGPTTVILVGHTGMPKSHLKENIMSLVEQLKNKYPGGEANIRSIALKLPLSLSIPLYITLRPSSSVNNPPKLRMKKPKNFKDVEDELSTMPNTEVRVAPDGTVTLKKKKPRKSCEIQTSEEEEELSDKDEESE
ncbi:unnamed protein product [Diatraea saccharalis]|uniref:Ribosomal protein L1 n=1 Tax=Diatraea saccharalis TaxID=40085 RepID=A0A9N9QZ22_9NEOP|nr:unnamed protein product [Diatraea saccharalis]